MDKLKEEIKELMVTFTENLDGDTKKSQREARKNSLDLRKLLASFRKESIASEK